MIRSTRPSKARSSKPSTRKLALWPTFTDGISEAFDESGKEFGSARVIDVIERNCARTAKEIVAEIFAAVQLFCGDAEQSDDRTVVVVKINR